MTWPKARQYCKSKHVDLASLRDAEDLQQLYSMRSNSTQWIGLKDSWKWSFVCASKYLNFKSGDHNIFKDNELCVKMESDGHWTTGPCSSLNNFLCLTGKR